MQQILLTTAFLLILYRLFNPSHVIEGLDTTSITADVDAVQNLSNIAASLLAGGITVPGNMKVLGNIDISTNIDVGGKISTKTSLNMNRKPIYLREPGESYHSVTFDSAADGTKISGYAGGKLSTVNGDIAKWNNNGLSMVNGGVFIPTGPMVSAESSVKDKKTLNGQGVYLGWNMNVGQGETDIINNKGGGPGGIFFEQFKADNTYDKQLGKFDGEGNFSAAGKITAANQLCIGGTCINEDKLKMLNSDKWFNLKIPAAGEHCYDLGQLFRNISYKDCGDKWAKAKMVAN